MSFFSIIHLFSAFFSIFYGMLIYNKNPRSYLNRVSFLLFIVLFLWAFAEFEYIQASNFEVAYFWARIGSFWYIAPSIILHIVLVYTKRWKLRNIVAYSIIYAPSIFLSVLEGYDPPFQPIIAYYGWTYAYEPRQLIYYIWPLAITITALCILAKYCVRTDLSQKERSESRYVFIGFLIPVFIGFLSGGLIQTTYKMFPDVTIPASAIGMFIFGIGIWKRKVFTLSPSTAAEEILSTMSDSLILSDKEGIIINLNKSALNLLGHEADELIDQPMIKFFPMQDIIFEKEFFNDHELDLKTKSGKIIPISVSKSTISKDDEIEGAVYICRDVTDRKRIQKMQDQFITNATHELRTPLVSIKGYLDRVITGKNGSIPRPARVELEIVRRNTDRLLSLTNELLDIRRIQSGKLQLKLEPLDFREVLEQCIKEIQPFIKNKKQTLQTKIQEGRLSLNGDRFRLSQAITNLLDNASKFTPEKGRINIEITKMKNAIRFKVTDTGIGIRNGDLHRVFEPFADIKKPTYIEGTGLGLSITKGLVEAHGGKIWAESPGEGKGATFVFELYESARAT
ncbi:ATP-binding protein [[Eubacterium] cellulosolvens]